VRYIYDDLVKQLGDPQVAPKPVPLTIRDWHREKRQARTRQEEVLRGVASRPDALRAED
jgi:hypothetical protein